MLVKFTLILAAIALIIGCKENEPAPLPSGKVALAFAHRAGGDSLQFNKFYTNAAGNEYKVVYLKYFISGVELYADGNRRYRQTSVPQVIDAKYVEERQVILSHIPAGSYDSLAFSLGVVPEYNHDNAFDPGKDHLGMYWPTAMGGGYHFMQFEGHWKDGENFGGFAFHLGENKNLITTGFPLQLKVEQNTTSTVLLAMDVNQWFKGPHLYDLVKESGYTMGDDVKMQMLVENGQNVFSLKEEL